MSSSLRSFLIKLVWLISVSLNDPNASYERKIRIGALSKNDRRIDVTLNGSLRAGLRNTELSKKSVCSLTAVCVSLWRT